MKTKYLNPESKEKIEKLARRLKERHTNDGRLNLHAIAEEEGLTVQDTEEFIHQYDPRTGVIENGQTFSKTYNRFALAHEIGHAIVPNDITVSVFDMRKEGEEKADYFAEQLTGTSPRRANWIGISMILLYDLIKPGKIERIKQGYD
jgi:hypothetical protein